MNVQNPITLNDFIQQLTSLKNKIGTGEIPVVLEGRDTELLPCAENCPRKNESCRLAVLIADSIETRYGDCDSLGRVAWIRGMISANGFVRPSELPTCDDSTGDTTTDDNKNLDGVVGDSSTNAPPCW